MAEKSFDPNQKLAIQGLPLAMENAVVPIGLEAKEAGEFTFSINHLDGFEDEQIFLFDAETEQLINLRENDYTVNLDQGEYNERFSLRFGNSKVTSLKDELAEIGVSIYSENHQIQINFDSPEFAKSEIAVYDISGQLIRKESNQLMELNIPIQQVGVYIIKVQNHRGFLSKKVLVY